jgi:hypothetical protein
MKGDGYLAFCTHGLSISEAIPTTHTGGLNTEDFYIIDLLRPNHDFGHCRMYR